MTQTKVIGESVKRTDRNFVKAYTDDYAKAITENYRQYHVHTLQEIYLVIIQSMRGSN